MTTPARTNALGLISTLLTLFSVLCYIATATLLFVAIAQALQGKVEAITVTLIILCLTGAAGFVAGLEGQRMWNEYKIRLFGAEEDHENDRSI